MNKNRLFLDIHAIQTLPPSNINRDDTGSPKTAMYGGVRRARVSSQSWKRAMREYFLMNAEQGILGKRSKYIPSYLADKIMTMNKEISHEEALSLSNFIITSIGIQTEDDKLKVLLFLSDAQIEHLAKEALREIAEKVNNEDITISTIIRNTNKQFEKIDNKEKKGEDRFKKKRSYLSEIFKVDKLKDTLKGNPSIDIALFGRMVADDSNLKVDASSQVAHAISTHAVQTEFDFFTAVDDLSPEDNAGAGMLGTVEFNSSTLYRYANIAVHELNKQLKDKEATIHAVKLFVETFSNSLPTGKVNTFANQTIPQAVIVTLRNDRPISLATAFEEPIKSSDGHVDKSIQKLSQEFKRVEKFVNKPLWTLYVTFDEVEALKEIGEGQDSLRNLLNTLSEEFSNAIQGE